MQPGQVSQEASQPLIAELIPREAEMKKNMVTKTSISPVLIAKTTPLTQED